MSAQYYRPQKDDHARSRLFYATALVIIVFLLDLVAGGRLRAAVRVPVSYAYLSIKQFETSFAASGIFASKHLLAAENEQLKQQLLSLKNIEAQYAALKDENQRLRTLSGLSRQMQGKAAEVISSLTASAYGTFLISIGAEDGIAPGFVVFTPDGFAIGTVTEAGGHTALVNQFFAPGTSVEALVGETRVVLSGQGGGNARAKAPRESTVSENDVVRAPKYSAPVGVVEHIVSEVAGADKELYVRLPANLQTLSLVYVVGK